MMNEKEIMQYTDIVIQVHGAIKDITDDNRCGFDSNVDLFFEGLKEDVYDLAAGNEYGVRPKEEQDLE
jgi:hypothetical protein